MLYGGLTSYINKSYIDLKSYAINQVKKNNQNQNQTSFCPYEHR